MTTTRRAVGPGWKSLDLCLSGNKALLKTRVLAVRPNSLGRCLRHLTRP